MRSRNALVVTKNASSFFLQKTCPAWSVLHSGGLGISFHYYWPTLLALVSRAAPAKVNSTLMGRAFMSLFISNNLVGWIGGFYEKLRPVEFWAMHAAIAAGGGLLVALFGRRLSRALHPARSVDELPPNRRRPNARHNSSAFRIVRR